MQSVFQKEKKCWFCDTDKNLQNHHIYGGGRRQISEQYGLKVYLCFRHHTGSNEAVHRNVAFESNLKELGQRYWEENIGTREQFIRKFGRCYL